MNQSEEMTDSELREEYKSYLGVDCKKKVPESMVMEMVDRGMEKTVKHYILSKGLSDCYEAIECRDVKTVSYEGQRTIVVETEDGEEINFGLIDYKRWRKREEELNFIDLPSVAELKAVTTE